MKFKGYTKKQLLEIYHNMALSRQLDDKQLILLKQGKGFFHIGSSGHEAAQLAAASLVNSNTDYSYPYYRNQAYCIGLGMTQKEILLSFERLSGLQESQVKDLIGSRVSYFLSLTKAKRASELAAILKSLDKVMDDFLRGHPHLREHQYDPTIYDHHSWETIPNDTKL